MLNLLIALHIMISVLLLGVILLQKEDSGLGGLSGAIAESAMTAKVVDSILVKSTYILTAAFLINCLIMGNYIANIERSLLD